MKSYMKSLTVIAATSLGIFGVQQANEYRIGNKLEGLYATQPAKAVRIAEEMVDTLDNVPGMRLVLPGYYPALKEFLQNQ